MEKNISFESARNLSLIYVIFTVLSFFFDIGSFGFLFLLIVFPFILKKLEYLLCIKYELKSKMKLFSIVIVTVITSTALPLIGALILSSIVDMTALKGTQIGNNIVFQSNPPHKELILGFAVVTEILMVARGISFLLLSSWLAGKFSKLSSMLKFSVVTLMIFGIHTVITGLLGLVPRIMQFFSSQETMLGFNIFKFSLPILIIFLFGSLFFVFKKAISKKENGNIFESQEQ